MHPSNPSKRRRRSLSLTAEALETRELLTGGAGDTFAIVPGAITTANQTTVVKFTIDPSHFTVPKGKFTLGIDIATPTSSTTTTTTSSFAPIILGVQTANGKAVPATHSLYSKNVQTTGTVKSAMTTAVLTPVTLSGKAHNGPVTYQVVIEGNKGATGQFLLGFYLPGDANGDGTVDKTDIATIKSEIGQNSSSSKYTFGADVKRNGKIDRNDLAIAKGNLGVSTSINASVSANYDPANNTGLQDRATTLNSIHFSGTATPGASVTYAEINNLVAPTTTTADASGNYSIHVPLGAGSNTFRVTTQDAFGQSISGVIAAVNHLTAPPVTASSVTSTSTSKSSA